MLRHTRNACQRPYNTQLAPPEHKPKYKRKKIEPVKLKLGLSARQQTRRTNRVSCKILSVSFDTTKNTKSITQLTLDYIDTAPDVIKAIQWSENLDQIFRDNYKNDPTLSWQFFGSSTGFMRQFPASKWRKDVPVDLYDCRLRSWYMEAATSPKDIVILMDGSGSMLGQRLDIAKHVVNTILDTLGTNDFVNIFTFDKEVSPVVPCFEDTLIQVYIDSVYVYQIYLHLTHI